MPLVFPFWASCVIRGAGLQSCGRRPRRPVRARIWLLPLREERVLEAPRRPGGLPHEFYSIPDIGNAKWRWAEANPPTLCSVTHTASERAATSVVRPETLLARIK